MKEVWERMEKSSFVLFWAGVMTAIALLILAILFLTYAPEAPQHAELAGFFGGASQRVLVGFAVLGIANDISAKAARHLSDRGKRH